MAGTEQEEARIATENADASDDIPLSASDSDDSAEEGGDLTDDQLLAREFKKALRQKLPKNRGVLVFEQKEKITGPAPVLESLQSEETIRLLQKQTANPANSIDHSGLGPFAAFEKFVAKELDIPDGDSDILGAMAAQKDVEYLHKDVVRNTESLRDRIKRLKDEILRTSDAMISLVADPDSDEVGDRATGTLSGGLKELKEVMDAVCLSDGPIQKRMYGPPDVSAGLYDPVQPRGWDAVQSIRTQVETSMKQNKTSGATPICVVPDLRIVQGVSYNVCNEKSAKLASRLDAIEKRLKISRGEPVSHEEDLKDRATTVLGKLHGLINQTEWVCDDRKLGLLERKLEVLSTEMDLLEGRGTPAEELDPDMPDEWNTSLQLTNLHSMLTENSGLLQHVNEIVKSIGDVEDNMKSYLTLMRVIHKQERYNVQLNDLARSTNSALIDLKTVATEERSSMERCVNTWAAKLPRRVTPPAASVDASAS